MKTEPKRPPLDPKDYLIEQCRNGDQRAMMELYDRYARAMYNTCKRLLNDETDAEDAMQEAFMKAFDRLDQFSGGVTFGAWLKKIVVHQCLDRIKKREIEWISTEETILQPVAEAEDDRGTYQVEQVHRAIDALPGGYKMILSLYLLEGYDHEEIAQILCIDPGTSRSQFARAKNKLKHILTERHHVG
ncbi:RNA polymerase sigma factor [Cryomorphaceae bacterium]|nr:RNA polymerase sigma factor [Cryomorphaceae bacterium]